MKKKAKIVKKSKELPIKVQIQSQRKPISEFIKKYPITDYKESPSAYIKTGIEGFDALLTKGVPKSASVLIAGGPGSGKTIFCLQSMYQAALKGEKCFYMSFEESEERLRKHMSDFGWKEHKRLEKEGKIIIQRLDPFDITRSVMALLEKAKGELLIDIEPVLLPIGFKPDRVYMDSLSAIAAAFVGKEESYRTYLEQLFRLFEKLGATSFLITETEQFPRGALTRAGVEEFLADGIVILYNVMKDGKRTGALEILKLRGAKHKKKIVEMQITDKGIMIYPTSILNLRELSGKFMYK